MTDPYKKKCKDGVVTYEHRKAWEAHTGQKIPKGMVIHHINGLKLDNRVENLMLVTPLDHSYIHAGHIKKGKVWYKGCRRCKAVKPLSQYYSNGKCGAQKAHICKTCERKVKKIRRKR